MSWWQTLLAGWGALAFGVGLLYVAWAKGFHSAMFVMRRVAAMYTDPEAMPLELSGREARMMLALEDVVPPILDGMEAAVQAREQQAAGEAQGAGPDPRATVPPRARGHRGSSTH